MLEKSMDTEGPKIKTWLGGVLYFYSEYVKDRQKVNKFFLSFIKLLFPSIT